MEPSTEPVRIDKWLWAARFYKNRGLASEAVKGGRIEINDARVKPSKDVRPGDVLQITIGQERRIVEVLATSERRGPATFAALMYAETPESIERRERQAQLRRMSPPIGADRGERPTKRDRRMLEKTPGARRGRR